jgi:hypothetical protein
MAYTTATLFCTEADGELAGIADTRLQDVDNGATDDTTIADWGTTTTFRYIQWRPEASNTVDAGATPFASNGIGWNVLRTDMNVANPVGGTNVVFTDTERRIRGGVWNFRIRWRISQADALAAANEYRTRASVYRIETDDTRTFLFDAERTYSVAEVADLALGLVVHNWDSAAQAEFAFDNNETLHVDFHVRGRGLAITGRTATFSMIVTDGSEARILLPGDGLRTNYRGTLTIVGRAIVSLVRKTKAIRTAAARGIATLARKITAFRALTTAARGIVTLIRKMKTTKTAAARGIVTLVRKTKAIRAAVARGTVTMIRKTKVLKTATARGVAILSRLLDLHRTLPAAAKGVATLARELTLFRALTASARGAATMIRKTRKILTTSARGVATLARKIAARRALIASARGVVTMGRLIRKALTVAARGIVTMGRLGRYRRTLTTSAKGVATGFVKIPFELIPPSGGPTDFSGSDPTFTIAGVVRDGAGDPVSGAMVRLMRESDHFKADETTSAVDGTYSFTRDSADPNTYYVVGHVASDPTMHGTSRRELDPA